MEEGMLANASEQATTPAIEQQTPETGPKDEPIDLDATNAEATAEAGSTPEGEQPPAAGEQEQQVPTVPDTVEIELNGKKYAVPAELKDGYLMQADYTRKTQEVAEMRKAAESIKAEAQAHLNLSKEVLEARAHLINIDGQLKQYENVNWQQLESEDPMAAMSHWRQFQQLQQARTSLSTQIDQFQRQASEKAEQETVTRLRETRAFAEKNIKGWNEQLDADIVNFANSELGFTRDALRGAINPQIYKTLHLAMLGQKFLQAQQSPQKTVVAAPTQPLRTVTAKASPAVSKNPEDMSMDEYVAFRKAQTKR